MKDPAVLFYTQDFLTGTMLMNDEQKGKYITLLCLQHQNGKLSEKDMLKICGSFDEDIWSKFNKDQEGNYYNKRMTLESEKRNNFCNSRRKNLHKEQHMDTHMDQHMENENENENEDINKDEKKVNYDFDVFWNMYAKKVGDKERCRKKWNKLTDKDRTKILETLPEFIASITDKQFQPFPETYLNQKRWNDEIIEEDNHRVIGGYYED